jgi:hypothetical protein
MCLGETWVGLVARLAGRHTDGEEGGVLVDSGLRLRAVKSRDRSLVPYRCI